MLKKLHIKLTVICIFFTSIILITNTVVSLYFSEKQLYASEYYNFLNISNSILFNLQNQEILSHNQLRKAEVSNDVIIYIEDNAMPSYYNTISSSKSRDLIIDLAKDKAKVQYDFDISSKLSINKASSNIDFTLTHNNKNYFVTAASTPNEGFTSGTLIIHPLTKYNFTVFKQRVIYIVINIVSIALLAIFSFFFSKKTIEPIIISRKKQNQFIASASHELRLPITVITTCASAIKDANLEEQNRFVDIITSEGNRMSRLVNDMLTLASANSNSWSVNFNYDDIDTTLIECYEFFQLLASEKHINLKIVIPDIAIPKCTYDKQRITQVLSILVNNALSYTPKGGWIKLSLGKKDNNILLYVIDNGVGISATDKEHIFEPFYRADNSHNSKEHFGLGLSVAYEIVKLHKGNIIIEDTPNGGTTFIISLPIL